MNKTDHNAATNHQFASLEKVLVKTVNDAINCLKLLKKKLSDYDSRHGNHFINTAVSYMRSDMRAAKDTAVDLKRIAHDIKKSPQPNESDIHAARNTMNATAKAMDHLQITARSYDQGKGRSKGVKGTFDNVVGHNDKEKHEKEGSVVSKSDDTKFKESKVGKIFGKDDADKQNNNVGLFGKNDREKDDIDGGKLGGTSDHHHASKASTFGASDTVETLVKSTLSEHFDLQTLSHQIDLTEKSLMASPTSPTSSPTFVERAKEKVKEVKEKLMGDSSNEGHDAHKQSITP
ncbi:uncharacterized protein PHALS_02329 [Plasmopara halstedii]|uniref:Uncharacterized protein n=1 Tax=Plasmopara halstedii TaxID=4781 RepID=A0A0P1AUH3_PLAHL|nr:uncharacterized protein PHALS_02329 [Plasmopara halstedii]CEG46001.1 hypothetical protein PHALS_02329 [Plasmopara halstedii]|eukprot:XP_024582370.1 hypothetical protein PHALS_02329 [Plasmopara halstedii]